MYFSSKCRISIAPYVCSFLHVDSVDELLWMKIGTPWGTLAPVLVSLRRFIFDLLARTGQSDKWARLTMRPNRTAA